MDDPRPPCRWWRKKRWTAALLLWLAAAYPLSFGPLGYLHHRGWAPARYWIFLYRPLDYVFPLKLSQAIGYYDYCRWWFELGDDHRWGPNPPWKRKP